MTERIHDDEPDTGEAVARELLARECPQWQARPLDYVRSSGTSNAMWRIRSDEGPDLVMRMPRRPAAAADIGAETAVLQTVAAEFAGTGIETPRVRHLGQPHEVFTYPWSVLEWIDGADAWEQRHAFEGPRRHRLTEELAQAVAVVSSIPAETGTPRTPGSRGGPLQPVIERLQRWLDDPAWNAASLVDVDAVRRRAAEAEEIIGEPVEEAFVHGDLIPGNLLMRNDTLAAIIDWSGGGRGDLSQDLAPAWAVLESDQRSAFRSALEVDDATWIRGRTFELEHAVGGVLYYVPRRHLLGDIMSRTLTRILADD